MKGEEESTLIPRGKMPAIPGLRRVWRTLMRWRFRLFHTHRYDRLVLERIEDLSLLVLPGVFNPGLLLTGAFMKRELGGERIPEGAEVLDLGCGSGIGSVIAAPSAAHVVASDINPAAVRNARINVLLHGHEAQVEVLVSDLFEQLEGRRFDRILFNPPFYAGAPRDDLDRAWRGEGLFERFAAQLPQHLKPGGRALVVFSSAGDLSGLLAAFRAHELRVELLAEHDTIGEILVLYSVRPAQSPDVSGR